MRIVNSRLSRDVAAVAVPGYALDVLAGVRVGEHIQRLLRKIPVVIPVPDQGADSRAGEAWAQVIADDTRSRRRIETHPGIISGLVIRFVLERDRKDRNSFRFVGRSEE